MRRVLALLVLLVAPASAHAGVVSLQTAYVDGYKGSGYTEAILTLTPTLGADDHVRIAASGSLLTLSDPAGVTAGPGCVVPADDPTRASCALGPSFRPHARITTADGDDTVVVADGFESVEVDGGPGTHARVTAALEDPPHASCR